VDSHRCWGQRRNSGKTRPRNYVRFVIKTHGEPLLSANDLLTCTPPTFSATLSVTGTLLLAPIGLQASSFRRERKARIQRSKSHDGIPVNTSSKWIGFGSQRTCNAIKCPKLCGSPPIKLHPLCWLIKCSRLHDSVALLVLPGIMLICIAVLHINFSTVRTYSLLA